MFPVEFPVFTAGVSDVPSFHDKELTVNELIRLIILKLISAIKSPTTISVIFFLASFTSAHFVDSIIHIIPLKITIVTASTIVILSKNLAILTIKGASVVSTETS
ncbi:MAG: hypothetical protein WCH65_02840 [bacterium]